MNRPNGATEAGATERRAGNGKPRSNDAPAGGRAGALEAPHRRVESGSRLLERSVVLGYRATAWMIAHVPSHLAWRIGGRLFQAGYLFWPKKRRWVNANFGHVLGLPPDEPEVRRLALAAYGNYARYLVELMRLPRLDHDEAVEMLDQAGVETFEAIRRESEGLILVVAHVGNNEAVAVGLASKGWPVSAVADDSSFPELFDHLRRQREAWGVRLIPWRNLREVYGVLRRKEMLALLVDWGYRADGIPVRLFGTWTTLPAGPAVLAARTGATILPIVIRRQDAWRFFVSHDEPIRVTSNGPTELARATQAIADALERNIAAAPEQWYSFKPMWPESAEERAALAERALAQGGESAPAAVS